MADNKSCEVIERTEEIAATSEREFNELKEVIENIGKEKQITGVKIGESLKSLKINIDCSDAITGLKAIQREAKKATAALKELDNIKKHTCPSCGKISLEINTLYANGEIYKIDKTCVDCRWSQ